MRKAGELSEREFREVSLNSDLLPLVFRLGAPLAFYSLFNAFFQLLDTMMASHVSSVALSSVSYLSQIQNLILSLGLGLVDKLGNLDDAVASAASKAGLEKYTTSTHPDIQRWYTNLLDKTGSDYMDSQLRNALGDYYPAVRLMRNVSKMSPIQARMPFDPNIR